MVIAYHRNAQGQITKAYEVTDMDEVELKRNVENYNMHWTNDQISIAAVPERSLMEFLFEKYRSRNSDDIALLDKVEDSLNEAIDSLGELIERAKYEVK